MKNQKGFTIIEGLLILVIVGLIGGVGWYVWQAKEKSDKSLDNAAQTEKTAASKKAETEKTKEFLNVQEWGVKISVDSSVEGLNYVIKNYTKYGQSVTVASFRSSELNKLSGDCASNSIDVARGKAKEVVPNEEDLVEGGETFEAAYNEGQKYSSSPLTTRSINLKIGDYYFVPPGYSGASCASDKTGADKETALSLSIVKVLNKMMSN